MPTVRASAKLNLYLDVLGRRDDGFHEIETLMVPLAWGDELTVEVGSATGAVGRVIDGLALAVRGPAAADVPDDGDNLALRAAQAFLDAALHLPVGIGLEKHVPPGTGLGGGSSDAAAVLRALGEAFPDVPVATRADIATGLGSDVPFFLEDGPAIGRGRGERIERLPAAPRVAIVLVIPPFGCDTAKVYAEAHRRGRAAPADGLRHAVEALAAGDPGAIRDAHYNALAVAALRAEPRMRAFTRDVERRLGRPPCLTGSGSALYDVPDAGDVERVARALDGLGRVVVTHT